MILKNKNFIMKYSFEQYDYCPDIDYEIKTIKNVFVRMLIADKVLFFTMPNEDLHHGYGIKDAYTWLIN